MCRIYHDNILCSSAKVLAETIHTIFDFFSILETLFFQQQTSKPTRILFKSSKSLHWFFLCVFLLSSKPYAIGTLLRLRTYKVLKTWGQKTKNWNNSGMKNTSVVVSHNYNKRGHFLNFFTPMGLENYDITHKRSVHIIHNVC